MPYRVLPGACSFDGPLSGVGVIIDVDGCWGGRRAWRESCEGISGALLLYGHIGKNASEKEWVGESNLWRAMSAHW